MICSAFEQRILFVKIHSTSAWKHHHATEAKLITSTMFTFSANIYCTLFHFISNLAPTSKSLKKDTLLREM